MAALAYVITRGGEHGWGDSTTLGAFVVSAVLMALFVGLQTRRAHPMLPLGLFRDRNRTGSYTTVLFIGGGLMATFYLLTQFIQEILNFSPVMAGLASLPVSVGIVLAAGISSKLLERLAPRAVSVPGLLIAASAMLWLSRLTPGSSYGGHVLPGLFLTYFGLGMGFMPLTLTAVHRVEADRAGVAAAMLNTAQQIGAALGVAVLGTFSNLAANSRLSGAARILQERGTDAAIVARASEAVTHGYATAFLAGAGMLVIAALVVGTTVTTRRAEAAPGVAAAH
jgi:predicted MFS family arabinose efflux permease